MRTWLICSCLAVSLLVVSVESSALKSRVTKELLLKLLHLAKGDSLKGSESAGNLKERISRVLEKVHHVQAEKKRKLNVENKRESSVYKLVELLKKTLDKRKPGSGKNSNEILGKPSQNVPVLKDAVKEPKPDSDSSEQLDEPLEVVEGGDIVELNAFEGIYDYIMLELFSSQHFCSKPIDQDAIDRQVDVITDMSEEIIAVMENTTAALDAAQGAEEIVTAIKDSFFGGFKEMEKKEEEATSEGAALFYRYILYGTTHNPHCQIGGEAYDFSTGETFNITERYDRIRCIGIGIGFHKAFIQSMFFPWTSDETYDFVTPEDVQNFEENRCNNASKLFWENFPVEVEMDAMVDAVTTDIECVVRKLRSASSTDEQIADAQENVEQADLQHDPIGQAIEEMFAITVEIMADIQELAVTLIMANPIEELSEEEKRVLSKWMGKKKRHF